jgi:hypothetical protein
LAGEFLGNLILESRLNNKKAEADKRKSEFASAFLECEFDEDEEEIEQEICFYLWEKNQQIYDLFAIVRNYLNEFYGIDSAILLALVKDLGLPVVETLEIIPFIHSGYLTIILADKENGDK